MTESQLIEHAERLIENYFRDEMPDLLTVDVEKAHLEVVEWMRGELPDEPVPDMWEFRIAYDKLRKAQANPVHTDEGKWWFWTDDATEAREGPFNHEHEARQELAEWIAFEKDLRGDP